MWIPAKSHFTEGLSPWEGEYSSQIYSLVRFVSGRPIPINVEVNDEDFKNPVKSKESIKQVLRVLELCC